MRIALRIANAALLALVAAPTLAAAQTWPTRPIKVIIPFTAGSATDTMARPVLDQLSKQLGQTIVVENRPGAVGTVGMAAVASSEADGYTLLAHSNSFTVVPSTYKNLSFDTVRDFVGISPIALLPMALVVAPGKYATIKDYVAAVKAKPGTFGSAGIGGATHLGAERFRLSAGFESVHVPYRGSADALRDVMTERVDFYLSPIGLALPLIESGKLAALAVASSKRSEALPNLPTLVEAGYPNSDYNVWIGLWAPSRTPQPIVAKLHEETVKALQSPAIQETFKKLAAETLIVSLPQFKTMIEQEIELNAGLVKALGIPLN